MIGGLIERWALAYLKRRGMVVLPRAFVGMALGYSQAVKLEGDNDINVYRVEVPAFAKPIILNHSMLIDRSRVGSH
ncbi:MAG TPA: hypothetical protein VGR63_18920 [Casimicrobiaceae bacterium]|jgi:hypothetical protein|nr:hypothetical protein [Casimicrobiaceae bacterium]